MSKAKAQRSLCLANGTWFMCHADPREMLHLSSGGKNAVIHLRHLMRVEGVAVHIPHIHLLDEAHQLT